MPTRSTPEIPAGLERLGHGTGFRERLCEMLESTRIFADLSRQEIEDLAEFVSAFRAKPDTIVFHEGQRDSYLCLVIGGRLDVLKEQTPDTVRKLATVRTGRTIGEMSLIDGLPHSATVVATEETTMLLLYRAGLERLTHERPQLATKIIWKFAQQLSYRLRQTSGILVDYL